MHLGCYYDTALDIEVDPQRCCFGSRQSDFALQAVVECRALDTLSESENKKSDTLVCVCITAGPTVLQSCSRGGERRVEDTCYERRRAEA